MGEVVSFAVGEIDPFARACGRGSLPPFSGDATPNIKRESDVDVRLSLLEVGMVVVPRYGKPWTISQVRRRPGALIHVHDELGACRIYEPDTNYCTIRRSS